MGVEHVCRRGASRKGQCMEARVPTLTATVAQPLPQHVYTRSCPCISLSTRYHLNHPLLCPHLQLIQRTRQLPHPP